MTLVSFRLFCKNLGNLWEFLGQMVHRPPLAKKCPYAYELTNEHGHPTFFSRHCNQLIISFAREKTNLISIAENWINKENSKYTVVFSICRLVTMSRNVVQILIKDSALCLIQIQNVYLCPSKCTDFSLMHVLKSLSHKSLQLLLRKRSSNKHWIMLKWGIFNAWVYKV